MPSEPAPDEQREKPDERLPYEPPTVVAEEVFETLALACGKLHNHACRIGGGLKS